MASLEPRNCFRPPPKPNEKRGELALCRAQVSDTGAAAHAGISCPEREGQYLAARDKGHNRLVLDFREVTNFH
jgi:hypothetical protein